MRVLGFTACLLCALVSLAFAGDPRYVAGASYFDPAVKGMPITWAGGQLSYYTDQGQLSSLLPHANADTLVADSFARWTSVPTAALSATQAGQLSEDVNGTNVTVDSSGAITVPLDIQPTATDKPVAIIYDADGAVTDAFLGAGAGLAANCFTNAVFGGVDAFTPDAHFAHALVIVNGNCAQTSSDLPELQYRLVRVLGQVLGLGWSQLNLNVLTGKPQPPTMADRAGFPVMHYMDPVFCVPITRCYLNPDQPKMDDAAALSRLYPVTPQNQGMFPGKVIFSESTARVQGSVFFVDSSGHPIQPMQGVNVVARWVDPNTNLPSRQYAASSVSGFLFRGNAGNPVTGYLDSSGEAFDRFGSDDASLEGAFDIGGLQIPAGASTATYELTVESIDPNYSQGVGPYGPWQVQASGSRGPIHVVVSTGRSVQQDIAMTGSASEPADTREPDSFTTPAPLPLGGDWTGSLSGYGDSDYYSFRAKANRTLSIEVAALDDAGNSTQDKARPVIGMWSMAAPLGSAPGASTPTAFNTLTYGMTRLDARLLQSTNFRVAVADERGDGRPDYRYRARILYGDAVTPARTSVAGGNMFVVDGMGFQPDLNVQVGSTAATVVAATSKEIVAVAPPMADGVQTITVLDGHTGGSTVLTDALTYGAGPDDTLVLLLGSNPQTPAGTEAVNPMRVQVIDADGAPVAGATVAFTSTPAALLSTCNGNSNCSVLTDETGEAATRITPPSAGVFTITASLAPASYAVPQTVEGTVSATSSALDIAFVNAYRRVLQEASLDLPLITRVVSSGVPLAGRTVSFAVGAGAATIVSPNAITDAAGYATTTLQIRNLAADVQVSACVLPNNAPCAVTHIIMVATPNIRIEAVGGSTQLIMVGQSFQSVIVRTTDSSTPANPVQAVPVTFASAVFRPDFDVFNEPSGESGGGTTPTPVILGSSQASVLSDVDGIATITPSPGSFAGPVEIEVLATAGLAASYLFELESIAPITATAGNNAQAEIAATRRRQDNNDQRTRRFHFEPPQ